MQNGPSSITFPDTVDVIGVKASNDYSNDGTACAKDGFYMACISSTGKARRQSLLAHHGKQKILQLKATSFVCKHGACRATGILMNSALQHTHMQAYACVRCGGVGHAWCVLTMDRLHILG